MKKIKFMLAAILILASYAAALSFKANRDIIKCVYTKSTIGNTSLLTKDYIEYFTETSSSSAPFCTILPVFGTTCQPTANCLTRLDLIIQD
jgi:hypothetical protein